ncbi:MAG: TrkA family potassium uptake protein [Vicingus serpentipes]|nr:TrkA family potassium uptake protein [Vicingus serpentipes]
MKYIIIGLGNFGSSLAEKLTKTGHEVIGVDSKMSKVEALKERITHTICIDCTDQQAVTHLPLKDTDVVIVCIGEDEGANIMATALMKRLKVKRLISRAVSPLHETVLEAMGVDEIVHPEEETADRWAKKLNLSGVVDSFDLTGEYSIIEATVPKKYVGQTLLEVGFRKNYNIVVMTTIKMTEEKNLIGVTRKVTKVQGVASSKTILNEGDILVMYGNIKDIERLLQED